MISLAMCRAAHVGIGPRSRRQTAEVCSTPIESYCGLELEIKQS